MAFNIADNFAKRAVKTAPKVEMLDINKLIPNKNNFYRVSDDPEIEHQNEQTKASIEMYGILQPLRVADLGNGEYKIIVGERRYLACKRLINEGKNFNLLPCIIEKPESAEDEQIKLIITNQHRDISITERMEEVKQLSVLIKLKKERGEKIPGNMDMIIAEKLNISKSEVGRLQQLNKNLEPVLKDAIAKGKLSMAAATELSRLSPEDQKAIYEKTGGAVKTKEAKEIQKNHDQEIEHPENMTIDGFKPLDTSNSNDKEQPAPQELEKQIDFKLCPFCGATAKIKETYYNGNKKRFYYECIGCGARTGEYKLQSKAKDAWNSRIK